MLTNAIFDYHVQIYSQLFGDWQVAHELRVGDPVCICILIILLVLGNLLIFLFFSILMTHSAVRACRLAVELISRLTVLVMPAIQVTFSLVHPLLLDLRVHVVELQLS